MTVLEFQCPFCEKSMKPEINTTGEIPVGTLTLCDCPESRAAWETKHRAEMEARKNLNRGTAVRSRSIVHIGRVPGSTGKRYRSRG